MSLHNQMLAIVIYEYKHYSNLYNRYAAPFQYFRIYTHVRM